MQLTIQGKNVDVTDQVRTYVEKRLNRLERLLAIADEARVDLAMEKTRSIEQRQVAQVTLYANGSVLRAEERASDIYSAIDMVSEKILRQVERFKGRRWEFKRVRAGELAEALRNEGPIDEVAGDEAAGLEDEEPRIVRVKQFALKPMDEVEAVEQMELLGHDFYVFFNATTEAVNVIYRRRDGNYGLLQPELP